MRPDLLYNQDIDDSVRKEEMIKLIVLSVLLNAGEISALPPEDTKIEARKRNKDQRRRRRGGSGLR